MIRRYGGIPAWGDTAFYGMPCRRKTFGGPWMGSCSSTAAPSPGVASPCLCPTACNRQKLSMQAHDVEDTDCTRQKLLMTSSLPVIMCFHAQLGCCQWCPFLLLICPCLYDYIIKCTSSKVPMLHSRRKQPAANLAKFCERVME